MHGLTAKVTPTPGGVKQAALTLRAIISAFSLDKITCLSQFKWHFLSFDILIFSHVIHHLKANNLLF